MRSPEDRRRYYLAHHEEVCAKSRKYRAENPDKVTAMNRNYYERHKQEAIEQSQRWRKANPDKFAVSQRASASRWYAAGGRKVRAEYMRKWREENPKAAAAIRHRHYKSHVESYLERNARRRALAPAGNVSYKKILEIHGRHCHICKRDILASEKLHFDHVIPLARGGAHSEDNILPSHARCNLVKNSKILN